MMDVGSSPRLQNVKRKKNKSVFGRKKYSFSLRASSNHMFSRYNTAAEGTPNPLHPMKENMTSPFIVESSDEFNLIVDRWSHNLLESSTKAAGKYFDESQWVLPGSVKFTDHFASLIGKDWNVLMKDSDRVILRHNIENVLISAHRESRLVKINVHYFYEGVPDLKKLQIIVDTVTNNLNPTSSTIEWVYDSHGSSITIPLQPRDVIASAYPWIKGTINSYIDNYLDSDSTVIVLIGPPGTGKTSLIKQIIAHRGMSAYVTYDPALLSNDRFFAMFMEGDTDILIMEDADTFLSNRKEGNTMMHRFLNMSDGLVTCKGKKLIFSTNLPNITDVDPALLRPGRCFDVLTHTKLDREQAKAVLREVGRNENNLPDGKSFTLAEILQQQAHTNNLGKSTIGFVR